jgi:DNA-binding CsgD family transcriptional regulator
VPLTGGLGGDRVASVLKRWRQRFVVTTMEERVLGAVAAGFDRLEIANRLRIKPSTVKTHVKHILEKTGHRGILQAANALLLEALGNEGNGDA